MPTNEEVLAKIHEFEHALDHVVSCGRCEDCQRLAEACLAESGHEQWYEFVREIMVDSFMTDVLALRTLLVVEQQIAREITAAREPDEIATYTDARIHAYQFAIDAIDRRWPGLDVG